MAPASNAPRERFVGLAALRGIVALLLVAFHAPPIFLGADSPIVRNAQAVTTLFFVLSGFIMMAAYGSAVPDITRLGEFVRKRLWRLYPLHLLATAVIVAVPVIAHGSNLVLTALFTGGYAGDLPPVSVNWTHVAADLFFLQGFGLFPELHLNFPSWSMGTLFWCTMLFGVLSLAPRLRAWAFAALFVWSMGVLYWRSEHYMNATFDYGFFRTLAGFALGVLAYPAYRRIAQSARVWQYCAALQALAVVGALAYVVLTRASPVASMAAPLVFAAVLLAFALDRGDFSEWLSGRPWQWLGERSYSLFMNQAAFLFLLLQARDWMAHFQLQAAGQLLFGTLAFAVYLAVLLVYSDWTYRNIELRFQVRARAGVSAPAGAPAGALPA